MCVLYSILDWKLDVALRSLTVNLPDSWIDGDSWIQIGGDNLEKGVQCYELFGGIALKNHTFSFFHFHIDKAVLNETRLSDEGSLVEIGTGYRFFWSGLPTVASRIHGVGFAIRTALLLSKQESPIAIDERLMTLRLPLAKNRFATFVSVYSPTFDSSDDVKDRFLDTLYSTLRRISQDDKIILLRDGLKSRHMAWRH